MYLEIRSIYIPSLIEPKPKFHPLLYCRGYKPTGCETLRCWRVWREFLFPFLFFRLGMALIIEFFTPKNVDTRYIDDFPVPFFV